MYDISTEARNIECDIWFWDTAHTHTHRYIVLNSLVQNRIQFQKMWKKRKQKMYEWHCLQ